MGFACIGDALGDKLNQLIAIRDKLAREKSPIGEDKWEPLRVASYRISEAVDRRDLESLAIAVRQMKNKLRRPYVKNALSRISEGKKKDPIEGDCVCARCGGTIENSISPCIDGTLCVKCGLDKDIDGPGKEKSDQETKHDVTK